jgi:hypothetical protein
MTESTSPAMSAYQEISPLRDRTFSLCAIRRRSIPRGVRGAPDWLAEVRCASRRGGTLIASPRRAQRG